MQALTYADIINAVGTILIPIVLAIWAWIQWRSDRGAKERQDEYDRRRSAELHLAEQRRLDRQRDTQLTEWGMRVVKLMAELESACEFASAEAKQQEETARRLAWQASALVDQGRLFYPNIRSGEDPSGFRPKLLDEVVRATYIAKAIVTEASIDRNSLRGHAYSARRRFIAILQHKTDASLFHGETDDIGSSISKDVTTWESPEALTARLYPSSYTMPSKPQPFRPRVQASGSI